MVLYILNRYLQFRARREPYRARNVWRADGHVVGGKKIRVILADQDINHMSLRNPHHCHPEPSIPYSVRTVPQAY